MHALATMASPAVVAANDPPLAALRAFDATFKRRRHNPLNRARINNAHPIARGCVFACPYAESGVDRAPGIQGFSYPRRVPVAHKRGISSIYGPGMFLNGSTDGITDATSNDLHFSGGPFTVAAMGWYNTALGGNYPVAFGRFDYTDATHNGGWILQHGQTIGWNFTCFNNNSTGTISQGSEVAAGQYFVVGTSNGTTRRLYVDGKQVASGTDTPNPVFVFRPLQMGLENGATGTIACSAAFAWTRELKAVEIAQLYADPFCFLRF